MNGKTKIPTIIYFLYLIATITIAIFFYGDLLEKTTYIVDGISMIPTYEDKERLYYNKNKEKYNRYDCVIFEDYTGTTDIKRIYGLPSETIRIENNKIYINGEKIEDNWNILEDWDSGIAKQEFHLKNNEYFVLGDNRNHSIDSRYKQVGTINEKLIIGIVIEKAERK